MSLLILSCDGTRTIGYLDGKRMSDTPRPSQVARILDEELDALLDEDLGDLDAISSSEARLIVATLRQTGRSDLAERIEPILDRVTKTDRPPPTR